ITASHVHSLMADHLTDVASSDQHTVKPWFDGKVDFAPSVIDLVSQGYPLQGGRLDYLEHRPVAALVYHRNKHGINLLLWAKDTASQTTKRTILRQGYNIIHWDSDGMHHWAISDLNAVELRQFADLIR